MNGQIFCCYSFCLPAIFEKDKSCSCCHETAYPRWHICVSGCPLAGLLAGIPVALKVTLFTPCLFPLPIQSLAEPAGWASPSAFSLVPLIFLFTILLLILEFTFLSKRFIGLLEFLAFFVATDLSIAVDDSLCSFPFLKGSLLESHAIFLLQAFLLIVAFFSYIS